MRSACLTPRHVHARRAGILGRRAAVGEDVAMTERTVDTPNGAYAVIDFGEAAPSTDAHTSAPGVAALDARAPRAPLGQAHADGVLTSDASTASAGPGAVTTAADGADRRPDVVLLHQIASCAQVWSTLGPALAEFSRPIAPDLCGHGRTRAHVESVGHLVSDLPDVLAALDVHDPVVVLEGEELLPLFGDLAGVLGATAVVVVGPYTWKRGEEAEADYDEVLGEGSLDEWDARNDMFATGVQAKYEEFVERRVARSAADWVNDGVEPEQLRAYIERQLREAPGGWERAPRRPLVEEALHAIGGGPFGLDLYDRLSVPVWLAVGTRELEHAGVDGFVAWGETGADRHVSLLGGHLSPDCFDPGPLADVVRAAIAATRASVDTRP